MMLTDTTSREIAITGAGCRKFALDSPVPSAGYSLATWGGDTPAARRALRRELSALQRRFEKLPAVHARTGLVPGQLANRDRGIAS